MVDKSAPADAPSAAILVVDDEPDILQGVEEALGTFLPQCTVLPASSGKEALEMLAKRHVDVIITDHRMPEMTGLRFLGKARQVAPRTPAMMLTAYPDLDLALRALKDHHIVNFLTKPIEAESLAAVVEEIIAAGQDDLAQKRVVASSLRRHKQAAQQAPESA